MSHGWEIMTSKILISKFPVFLKKENYTFVKKSIDIFLQMSLIFIFKINFRQKKPGEGHMEAIFYISRCNEVINKWKTLFISKSLKYTIRKTNIS